MINVLPPPDLGKIRNHKHLLQRRLIREHPDMAVRLQAAAGCYRRRQPDADKNVDEYPDGGLSFQYHDEPQHWLPNWRERRLCCEYAYQKHRGLLWHCRRPAHIAVLFNIHEADLRRELGLPAATPNGVIVNFEP